LLAKPDLLTTASPRLVWAFGLVIALATLPQWIAAMASAITAHSSDVMRQWRTSQYVLAGINPYPVALGSLERAYGRLAPDGPVHLKGISVYDIPSSGPHPQTDAALGPPEATYPPTGAVIIAYTIGKLPPSVLPTVWSVLNLVLVGGVLRELVRIAAVRTSRAWAWNILFPFVLSWPPVRQCIERGQFTLVVLWCVLVARRIEAKHPLLASLLYTIAMIKPSVGVPFLILPLLSGRLLTVVSAMVIQCLLLLMASILLHELPQRLLSGWFSVARYFSGGMYTSQEVINRLLLDGTPLQVLIPLLVLVIGAWVARRYDPERALAFMSLVAVFWVYHGPYDFVLVGVTAAWLAPGLVCADERDRSWLVCAAAIVVLGIALTHTVWSGATPVWRFVRWLGRLALLAAMCGMTQTRSSPGARTQVDPRQAR